ncbi:MAG TPA: hypothetical protein VKV38_03090 [Trebonia sp.]|jgi:hypothetical protein|nr:hypothetical protein [Trebonia sp.]
MPRHRRTYREVDGVRVEGAWRPVFVRDGGFYELTRLLIHAGGKTDCRGLPGSDEFRAEVSSGRIATAIEPGAQAPAHQMASWRMAGPVSWVTADQLIAEVRDEIARLRGDPASEDRWIEALAATRPVRPGTEAGA